jgi:hypothetical protein
MRPLANSRTHLRIAVAALLPVAAAAGCVGTDIIRRSMAARIEVAPATAVLGVGQEAVLQATYYGGLGTPESGVEFAWSSSRDDIAAVDAGGRVVGVRPGTAAITATGLDVMSAPVVVTVVAEGDEVASIAVMPAGGRILAGETLRFQAAVFNALGQPLAVPVSWRSSNTLVARIDSAGLATGVAPGSASITATANGVDSAPAILEVTGSVRTGTFVPRPGGSYQVRGTATLERLGDGSLRLTFGPDFASSAGPGLGVFLSSSSTVTGASYYVAGLGSTLGMQTYTIPAGVGLNTYDYVIIHCIPFQVTFGYAQLLP